MSIVTVQNTRYTADPLYQWDLNQVLEIRGLSLAFIPEIHFNNDNMDRAIVRQASMDAAGVITVDVPNSMLQKAGKLTVYVCTYEGETFQTLYKLELTVKARVKPSDYTLEDDPEVYSFNALENKIINTISEASTNYQNAASTLNQATATYNKATANFDEAARNYNEAVEKQTDAETKYTNALETLNGVEDGGVFVKKAGDTMGGDLDMGGHNVTNVGNPVADTDVVPKGYMDNLLAFDLLWENPDISAEFGGKHIMYEANPDYPDVLHMVNPNGYNLIVIQWLYNSESPVNSTTMGETVAVVTSERKVIEYGSFENDFKYRRYERIFNIFDDNLYFHDCNYQDTGASNMYSAPHIIKPYRIYGLLKKEATS